MRPWGGANLPIDHPLWLESVFKVSSGLNEEFKIVLQKYPAFPLWVRAGTADPNPFRQVFLENQYEDMTEFVTDPKVILDLGANVGYATMWFAMHFPNAQVIAVEPLKANVERIRKQVENAKIEDRVVVIEAAISDRNQELELYMDAGEFFHTGASLSPDHIYHNQTAKIVAKVECLSLDNLIEQYHLSQPDVIKIDIEGTETDLFSNVTPQFDDIMTNVQVLAIELHGDQAAQIVHQYFDMNHWRFTENHEVTTFRKSL